MPSNLYYICAKSDRAYDTVNIRQAPIHSAAIVGQLNTRGMLAERINADWFNNSIWWHWRLTNGVTGWIAESVHKLYNLPIEGDYSTVLPVPHLWQHAPEVADDHPNDCGSAGLASILSYYGIKRTVDHVSNVAGLRGREFSHFADLIAAAKYMGLKDAAHKRPCHIPDILASLDRGCPVLALVNYSLLIDKKNYGHFVVISGYRLTGDKMLMYIVDPNLKVPPVCTYDIETVAAALAEGEKVGNRPYQAMLLEKPPQGNREKLAAALDGVKLWAEYGLKGL